MKNMKSKNRRTLRTICLLLFATLSFTVHAQITVHLQDLPLRTSLKKIEQVSSYKFFWNENLPELNQNVSLDVKNATIDQTMKQLLGKMELTYRQDKDNVIVLMRKEPNKPATKTVTGTVVDANGEPIIGASVVVKGSPTGTITDMNGRFTLTDVPEKAMLTVSYVGYKAVDMAATGGVLGKVVLQEDSKMIDEVVVVGYGKMRKSDFTGSLSNVKADELPLTSPTVGQALMGKVAGVQVSMPNGQPGQGAKISIRGVNSLSAGSSPLYVIDGYPASEDVYINPEDIESIDVLKDAASAAIYGSRGASGVIMITTKRGAAGKVRVDYDYQYSVQQLERKIKMMNAYQFRDLVIEARNNSYRDRSENKGLVWGVDVSPLDDNATRIKNGFKVNEVGIDPMFFDFATGKPVEPANNTDWQDAIYGNAPMQRHNISVSGGNDKLSYRFSAGYLDQDGIIAPSNHRRMNVRANVDAQVSSRLKTGINFSFSDINERLVSAGGRFSDGTNPGIVMTALVMYPQSSVYNADGSYTVGQQIAMAGDGYAQAENPVALAHEIDIRQHEMRMNFNANISYEILKQLSFNANLGTQYTTRRYNFYRPRSIGSGTNMPNSAGAISSVRDINTTNYDIDRLGEFTLNYKESFGLHKVDAIAGYTMQKKTYDRVSVLTKGFPNDMIHEITAHGPDPGDISLNGSDTRKAAWTMMSYLGRINYIFADRYALSATIRTDGSSRFGPKNRWGLFPSISAGWTISNEKFWKNETSKLKLRVSWGLSGNNNIGNYEAYSVMTQGGYPFGDGTDAAYWQGAFADAAIGWEKTSQYNIGIDYSLFNNRLSVIANYYNSNSYNLLYNQPLSAISGSSSVTTNLSGAKVNNSGFDLQVDARLLSGAFKWNVSGNISVNRNKVMDMGGLEDIYLSPERSVVCYVTKSGQPVGSFYGYRIKGIASEADMMNINADKAVWKSNGNKLPADYKLTGPAVPDYNNIHAGDIIWQDTNADGIISGDDRDILGNAYPDFTYGFSTNFSYKNFDLQATFTGSQGNEVINFSKYYLWGLEGYGNQLATAVDRYHSDADPGRNNIPRAARHSTPNISTRLSSYFVEDASYLRCANITLGYNAPAKWLQRISIQALRLYVSADNLFTITDYQGYNPDVDYKSGNNLMPGFDWGVYPLSRSYSVGVKVTF